MRGWYTERLPKDDQIVNLEVVAEDEMRIDLDALANMEAAATTGPWVVSSPAVISHGFLTIALCWSTMLKGGGLHELHNAELIVALRNAAPELIRLARLGQALERGLTDVEAGRVVDHGTF